MDKFAYVPSDILSQSIRLWFEYEPVLPEESVSKLC